MGCNYCQKEFTTKQSRDDHQRKHTGDYFKSEVSLKCHHCSETFDLVEDRTKHMFKVHPELTYNLKLLDLYDGKAAQQETYICEFCSKTFHSKWNLKKHLLVHTGDKPFKGELCDAKYTQKPNLVRHIAKAHEGEVFLKCYHCSEKFDLVEDRTKH